MPTVLSGLGRALRRAFGRSRIESRHDRNDIVYLYSATDLLGPVVMLDWSETGAKLGAVEDRMLTGAAYLLDPPKRLIHGITVAWSAGEEAGVTYTRSWSVRGYTDDASLRHVKAHWATLTGVRSDDRSRE